MNIEAIGFILILFFTFLNFLILFFLSAFLVRLRIDFFNILNNFLDSSFSNDKDESKHKDSILKQKTWDQKYEDDLEAISNRIKRNGEEL